MRIGSGLACAISAFALSTILSAAGAPKVAVILVVDQMRADYVDRFQADWTSGLKRLFNDGARFTAAAYPYLGTLTCAGHATIATGTFPSTHGIFQNTWYDRGRGSLVTCTDDAAVQAVSYGAPITGGDSAAAMKVTNFADQMKLQKGSRVVSLALKARSAIMLGGHHADAVTWMSESPRAWQTSTAYSTQPVSAVAEYLNAHPVTRDLAATWDRLLPSARYREADNGVAEAPPAGWTASFPHKLSSSGAADEEFNARWERSPFADRYIAQMAAGLVDAMKLGTGDVTDVLTVSFSSPDLVGHAFGPNSQEIHDMYVQLDRTIGALLDHLDATLGKGQYVVGLSADHGVTELPEQIVAAGRDGGRVNTQAIAAAVESTASAALGAGRYVARINGSDVYFAPGQYEKLKQNPAVLQAVIRAIMSRPGIERVFRSEELASESSTSSDALRHAAALSYVAGRSGDLVLALKAGWINVGTGTTHGSANPDDQHVPLVFYGYGIKPGKYPTAVTPADLAPTLAAVAGITLPDASGRPLRPALQPGSSSSARTQP